MAVDAVAATAKPPVKGLVVRALSDARVLKRVMMMDKYVFPVSYSEAHYQRLAETGLTVFNQVAFYHEMLVGSCMCRLETVAKDDSGETLRLYIMTIGVLKPYRGVGIGSVMLQRVLNAVKESPLKITEVALNVQVGSEAVKFYQAFGFEVVEEVKNYYTNLEVTDALLLRKVVQQNHSVVAKKK